MVVTENAHTHIEGRTAGHPACAACNHVHRYTVGNAPGPELVRVAACGCGCLADSLTYEYGDRPWFSRADLAKSEPKLCKSHHLPEPCGLH